MKDELYGQLFNISVRLANLSHLTYLTKLNTYLQKLNSSWLYRWYWYRYWHRGSI